MSAEPKLRLVVRYPDGREASYPLQPGRFDIGSAESCPIRIEHPQVAAQHALLIVDDGGVSIVNLEAPQTLLIGDAPVRKRTPIALHDPVRLADIEIELVPLSEGDERQTAQSPDGTAGVRDTVSNLGEMGAEAYPYFQKLMSPQISPIEAEQAHKAFHEGLAALGLTVACGLTLYGLMWHMSDLSLTAQNWCNNGFFTLVVFASLVLVSRFRVPFAGRLLLPAAFVFSSIVNEVPQEPWDDHARAGVVLLIGLFMFLAAWLFDFGASTRPDRSRPSLRRASLTAFGVLWLGILTWSLHRQLDEKPDYLLFLPFGVCAVWSWWPARWMERQQLGYVPDVWEVLHAAFVRWGRWARGRTLALICGLLPFFLFLTVLGFHQRLDPAGHEHAVVAARGGVTNVWYFPIRARLLQTRDFEQSNLYLVSANRLAKWVTEPQLTKLVNTGAVVVAANTRLRLQANLQQDGVNKGEEFKARWAEAEDARVRDTNLVWMVLLLEQHRTRFVKATSTSGELCVVDNTGLRKYTDKQRANLRVMPWVSLLYLSYCVVGFIILWRRGGDSAL